MYCLVALKLPRNHYFISFFAEQTKRKENKQTSNSIEFISLFLFRIIFVVGSFFFSFDFVLIFHCVCIDKKEQHKHTLLWLVVFLSWFCLFVFIHFSLVVLCLSLEIDLILTFVFKSKVVVVVYSTVLVRAIFMSIEIKSNDILVDLPIGKI